MRKRRQCERKGCTGSSFVANLRGQAAADYVTSLECMQVFLANYFTRITHVRLHIVYIAICFLPCQYLTFEINRNIEISFERTL